MNKKVVIGLIVVILIVAGLYLFRKPQSLIGFTYTEHLNYPGVEEWGQGFESNIDSEHNLRFVKIDGRNAILFSHIDGHSDANEATYTALDTLYFPDGVESLRMDFCGPKARDFEYDPEIVADDIYDRTKDSFPVLRAWKANRESKKFEEIPPEGIWCINEAGANYSG